MSFLGSDITPLSVSVQNVDASVLRVTIGAAGRWEVPQAQLFTNTAQGESPGLWHELRAVLTLLRRPLLRCVDAECQV
jgi:hypothetical protein